jgi:hypothetical protein
MSFSFSQPFPLTCPHCSHSFTAEVWLIVAAARARLDCMVEAWTWGLLFALWGRFSPWAFGIALLWMALAYYLMLMPAAAAFADLLLATFDTQRWRLYEALRWPLPTQSGEVEIAAGQALTRFIQRGMTKEAVRYQHLPD